MLHLLSQTPAKDAQMKYKISMQNYEFQKDFSNTKYSMRSFCLAVMYHANDIDLSSVRKTAWNIYTGQAKVQKNS